jgi:hypothetical protein
VAEAVRFLDVPASTLATCERIRPALTRLDEELGLKHAPARRRLYTHGAEVLYDYAERGEDEDAARAARELVVVRSDQRVFNEVVDSGRLRPTARLEMPSHNIVGGRGNDGRHACGHRGRFYPLSRTRPGSDGRPSWRRLR